MVMLTLSLALVGGIWLIYILDQNMSVAVGVGFIALAGVTAEFGGGDAHLPRPGPGGPPGAGAA